ncbi:hypothetical protein ABPG74_004034 [Tetrahymena malaccensis]
MFSKLFNFGKTVQLQNTCKRFFDLHEYQSKEIMRKFGIRVQKGDIALTPQQARKVAEPLDPSGGLILKAQVHAGGRGKGHLTSGLKGGVKVLKTPEEVETYTKQMIGYNLITHQTPKAGLRVDAVLVHEGVDIVRQIYLAFILDRNSQKPAIVASVNGGVDIEEVAKTHPESIIVQPICPSAGLTDADLNTVVSKLQLSHIAEDAKTQIRNLYQMFNKLDATQVEINPWATDPKDKLYCVDAKINIDDNAKFRQQELVQLRKNSVASEDVDPHEEKAIQAGLAYVALDGNIGCLVNGAGLAMGTMDIIKLCGGSPANFLDVGGGANVEQVKTAFEILNAHPKVETVFINIFGGILSCKLIAEGIIKAAQLVSLRVPLVVRLSGNQADVGRKLLLEFTDKNPSIKIRVGKDLGDSAELAVKTANEFAGRH